jgi:hypothetical protein
MRWSVRFAGRRLRNLAGAESDSSLLPVTISKSRPVGSGSPTLALESSGDVVHDHGARPLEDLIATASS